jgi:alpha-1,3-rhamnosyl/mannosyltransferase
MRRATRIFTVSRASRAALIARFRLEATSLTVVPEAPDDVFSPRSQEEMAAKLRPLGLEPGQFLVMAGGISPHKNLGRLVAAYELLLAGQRELPPLVLVGELESDPFLSAAGEISRMIQARSLAGRVLLPGYVEDETLACLYGGASAVVVPSLAEGFGLPAVEAAACGAAVVLSDIPAHRETLDGAAEFVSPEDVSDIARGIARVLDDPAGAHVLGERARTAVSSLSWEEGARILRGVLEEAVRA